MPEVRAAMDGQRVHADDTVVPVHEPGICARARPGCGHTCATTGRSGLPIRLPRSTATRRTARASSLSRWGALTLVLRDARACLDNSAAERAMRPVALGRRNWAFAGWDTGGHRAAAICSLIETAKLHGIDAEACLCCVIERIADYPVNRVGELLQWNLDGLPARLDQRLAG